jgi:hypothetical protein
VLRPGAGAVLSHRRHAHFGAKWEFVGGVSSSAFRDLMLRRSGGDCLVAPVATRVSGKMGVDGAAAEVEIFK